MAILVNRNTTQTPMTAAGRTGTQVLKFINADRVYVKTPDVLTVTPLQNYFTKSNGATPTGWTDLGVLDKPVKVTYDKKTKDVTTGIDNYFRAEYVNGKMATFEFELAQFDDVTLEQMSGTTPSVIVNGSIVSYPIGSEDIVQQALLLVSENKLDGKEVQYYNPSCYLNFSIEASGDQMILKVTGKTPFFTPSGATKEQLFAHTIFA